MMMGTPHLKVSWRPPARGEKRAFLLGFARQPPLPVHSLNETRNLEHG